MFEFRNKTKRTAIKSGVPLAVQVAFRRASELKMNGANSGDISGADDTARPPHGGTPQLRA